MGEPCRAEMVRTARHSSATPAIAQARRTTGWVVTAASAESAPDARGASTWTPTGRSRPSPQPGHRRADSIAQASCTNERQLAHVQRSVAGTGRAQRRQVSAREVACRASPAHPRTGQRPNSVAHAACTWVRHAAHARASSASSVSRQSPQVRREDSLRSTLIDSIRRALASGAGGSSSNVRRRRRRAAAKSGRGLRARLAKRALFSHQVVSCGQIRRRSDPGHQAGTLPEISAKAASRSFRARSTSSLVTFSAGVMRTTLP